jgi:arginine-tRNA-protein transferase
MFQCQELHSVSPAAMDRLWAQGWRHFGTHFFLYDMSWHEGQLVRVLPLRVNLQKFSPTRIQRRILNLNRDVRVEFRPATIDAEREALFEKHKTRFDDNVPTSLQEFISSDPARVPCNTTECLLFVDDRLFAVSYLDVGLEAVSAVYAMFDLDQSRRSPGIHLILEEIYWALHRGYRYVYLGYCYDRPSHYDYKKRFRGLECLDWQSNQFLALEPKENARIAPKVPP